MPLLLLLLTAAHAGKTDPCASIKPEQQLETSRQQQIDGMVKVKIAGIGGGEAKVQTDTDTTWDTRLLAEDDLARGWTVYQLCVMKRDGLLTDTLHEELMRELFGLEQRAATPAPQPAAVAPTTEAPVEVGETDGTSIGVVRGVGKPDALEMYTATELDRFQQKKYPRVTTVTFDVTGVGIGIASSVRGEATVMCGSEARKVVIPPVTSTGTWAYKGTWLAKKILKEAGCK